MSSILVSEGFSYFSAEKCQKTRMRYSATSVMNGPDDPALRVDATFGGANSSFECEKMLTKVLAKFSLHVMPRTTTRTLYRIDLDNRKRYYRETTGSRILEHFLRKITVGK